MSNSRNKLNFFFIIFLTCLTTISSIRKNHLKASQTPQNFIQAFGAQSCYADLITIFKSDPKIQKLISEKDGVCENCEEILLYTANEYPAFKELNTQLRVNQGLIPTSLASGAFLKEFQSRLSGLISSKGKTKTCRNALTNNKDGFVYRGQFFFNESELKQWKNHQFLSTSSNIETPIQYSNNGFLLVIKMDKKLRAKKLQCSGYPGEEETLVDAGQCWDNVASFKGENNLSGLWEFLKKTKDFKHTKLNQEVLKEWKGKAVIFVKPRKC
jgi:hypothetical protein